ncbi:MAG: YlxM family DNA-binding protein [Bacillota bacterium]|jgi:predicted DNA-binding protein YlxM (UPF0122 family)
MEKIAWINMLFDFYGQLLTDKQQKFIELYFGHDLSLGEIAENFGVSRQAVHDTLKRAEYLLNDYENKLGLVGKFMIQHNRLQEALKILEEHKFRDNCPELGRMWEIIDEVLEATRK